jgi:hypothetical protein
MSSSPGPTPPAHLDAPPGGFIWTCDPADTGSAGAGAVHLADEWEPHIRDQLRRLQNWTFSLVSIAMEGWALAIGSVVGLSINFLIRSTSPGTQIGVLFGTLGALLLFVLLVGSARRRRHRAIWDYFPHTSDPRYRVRVIGRPDLLEALRRSPPDVLSSFEPSVFRITCALESKKRRRIKLAFLCGGASILLLVGQVLLTGDDSGAYFLFMIGCTIGRFSRGFIWPTYLRLSPGRLDVLQYPFLGAGKPRIRSFDLHASRVALQIHGPLIVFPPGADDGELFPAASSPWFTRDPLNFERTALAASLSTAPAPPLPDDALVG